MATSTTTFEAERPAIEPRCVHQLRGTCKRLLDGLREIDSPTTDDAVLRRDVETVATELESLATDLGLRVELCRELARSIADDAGFLEDTPSDSGESSSESPSAEDGAGPERCWTSTDLRQALLDSRQVESDANEIIEIVYKVVPLRSSLGQLASSDTRAAVGRALVACGIRIERVYESRAHLSEALRGLDEIKVEGEVDLTPPPSESRTRGAPSRKRGEAPSEVSLGRDDTYNAVQTSMPPPGPRKATAVRTADQGVSRPASSSRKPLSRKELQQVRAALTQWARLRTFVPSDIGFQVDVIDWNDESAQRVMIDADAPGSTKPGTGAKLEEITHRGALPRSVLESASGRRDLDKVFTEESCRGLPHGPREALLAEATQRFESVFVDESIWPFLSLNQTADPRRERAAGEATPSYRLRVESIPVRRVTLELRADSSRRGGSRFEAWIYGNSSKVWVQGLPRVWTIKAGVWLGALTTIAAGSGFGLAKLLLAP